jgi:hypothetical protein
MEGLLSDSDRGLATTGSFLGNQRIGSLGQGASLVENRLATGQEPWSRQEEVERHTGSVESIWLHQELATKPLGPSKIEPES